MIAELEEMQDTAGSRQPNQCEKCLKREKMRENTLENTGLKGLRDANRTATPERSYCQFVPGLPCFHNSHRQKREYTKEAEVKQGVRRRGSRHRPRWATWMSALESHQTVVGGKLPLRIKCPVESDGRGKSMTEFFKGFPPFFF